jgi:hypothetical protein
MTNSNETRDAKPLAVSVKLACKLIGVGNTKMWGLIKDGRVNTVSIGRASTPLWNHCLGRQLPAIAVKPTKQTNEKAPFW